MIHPGTLGFLSSACAFLLAWAAAAADPRPANGIVSLDVHSQGALVDLLLASQEGTGTELLHLRSADGGRSWGETRKIGVASATLKAPQRGRDAQIAAIGDRIVAIWTSKGSLNRFGTGALGSAISRDGGRSWKPGPNPADDGSGDSHAFLDLVADGELLHAVWLDPRDGKTGLRYARSPDVGESWSRNRTVDSSTCQCCWNRVYSLKPGTVQVIYRDIDPRDMALQSSEDGGKTWERRGSVGAFGWFFNGCPHVGGALALTGETLHALVWTGKEGKLGLHRLSSRDFGKTWSEPQPIGDHRSRHADMISEGDRLAMAWSSASEGDHFIEAAVSPDGGRSWRDVVRVSGSGADASHPRIVASQGRFLVFWTEKDAAGRLGWKMKALPFR